MSVAGRHAVVTGASNGIGRAIAHALLAGGASVTGVDVEPGGNDVDIVPVDLADLDAVTAAGVRLADLRPDILVNCAGSYASTPLLSLDLSDYHRLLTIDLHAPLLLMKALAAGMAERGWGRIVNLTSVHTSVGEPGALAYDVAKAGLAAATRVAAIELAPDGVLVNAVAPGFVATRMSVVDGVDELDGDEFRTIYVEGGRIPLRRAATPNEIAPLVVWLAGDTNTYVTGESITADGGLTIRL